MAFWDSWFKKRDVNWDLSNPTAYVNMVGANLTVNSIPVNETSALRLSAVMACVRVVSQDFASLPFSFRYKDTKGDSFDAKQSNANYVMKYPNKLMTPFDFKSSMVACRMLHGNGYAQIVRDSIGNPVEIIPIHPSRVEPKIKNGELIYVVDEKVEIAQEDMLHFKGISTDGLVGISVLKAEAENISLALSAQAEYKKFYEKGSKLDGFISYPNLIDPKAKEKAEKGMESRYGGAEGRKIGVLDNGATFVKVGINPSEAMWLDMMGYSVRDICRIFGVPPHLIQDLQESTNNNIEHQSIDYVNHCMLPLAKCFEEELERKLLSESEKRDNYYCKFNMNGLLRGDSTARAELYKALDQMGALSSNDVRRLEDMNGYEGGDEYFRQLNQMGATKITDYYINAEAANNDKNGK